ncbi:unnamed protein product [Enterobius vermicularis]|uniref:Mpv17-like protein 2 n=1 Tax=Enterobius vermicularis TaxID=51028 RepID=A0A0N4VHV0_ENTVE|nr:unnamed protein product [Enterobius vermicularis]
MKKFFRSAFSPKYLLVTNTVSCTSLLAVGDLLQQYLHGEWDIKNGKPFDGWRTFRFSVLGVVIGPANHYWFKFLDSYFVHGRKSAIVAKKVISDLAIAPLDCVMMTPTQAFNFWVLPPAFRVVYTCGVLIIYDCILSHIKHNEK